MDFETILRTANRAIEGGQSIEQVCDKLAKQLDWPFDPSRLVARLRRELKRGANIRANTRVRTRGEDKGTWGRRIIFKGVHCELHATKGWRRGRSCGRPKGA